MRRLIAPCLALVLLLALGGRLEAQKPGAAIPSGDHAVQRAHKFFKDVGWTLTEETQVRFPLSKERPHFWQVRSGDLAAELNSATGRIQYAGRRNVLKDRREDVINLTEELAKERAVYYLGLAGLPLAEAKLHSNKPINYSGQPGKTRWGIVYRRIYKGFPSMWDFIRVTLDPMDGSLLSFGYNFDSPLPKSTRVRISKDLAVSSAREYLARLGVEAGNLLSAKLEIVQPNLYWEYWDAGVAGPGENASHLAWIVEFDAPWEITQVWLDAASGAVLGGLKSRSIPKNASRLTHLPLSDTDTIIVDPSNGESATRHLSMKAHDAQALVSAIGALSAIQVPEEHKPAMTLRFISETRTYTLEYSPADHTLVLAEKAYKGRTMKTRRAWKTTEEFEKLLSQYTGLSPLAVP